MSQKVPHQRSLYRRNNLDDSRDKTVNGMQIQTTGPSVAIIRRSFRYFQMTFASAQYFAARCRFTYAHGHVWPQFFYVRQSRQLNVVYVSACVCVCPMNVAAAGGKSYIYFHPPGNAPAFRGRVVGKVGFRPRLLIRIMRRLTVIMLRAPPLCWPTLTSLQVDVKESSEPRPDAAPSAAPFRPAFHFVA